ncbi:MAG: sugar ABC transporter permease [Thermomicrobiales bacterium]
MSAQPQPMGYTGQRLSPSRRWWNRYRAGILFVLPALVLYLIFVGFPFIQTIYFSLTDWNGVRPTKNFVGLANWQEMIRDPLLWKSLRNNVTWVIVGTLVPMAIGLLLAMLLWRRPRGFTLFRTVFFMPQVLSAVVIGIIWSWIYNPLFGNLNKLLKLVGLGDLARGWLGDPAVALYAVLGAAIWAEVGFVFVVFLAGLQNVSKDLLEAATIDGANGWHRFKDVTVPQLSNVINVVTALLLIGGFNVFDIVFVMTQGGPANATEVIATYTYKEAFTQNRVGYASTLSLVMTAIALVTSVAFIRLRERQEG